jgi:MFS family permease
MQSLTSKYANVKKRGATLGIFNSFGYFGTFCGGIVGGILLKYCGMAQIFWMVLFTCIAWLILIMTLKNPSFLQNIYIPFSHVRQNYENYLQNTEGIKEWYISNETLIVKFDVKKINMQNISQNLNINA